MKDQPKNHFSVGASSDGQIISILGLFPVIGNLPVIRDFTMAGGLVRPLAMTRENAMELAAWIVAIADPQDAEFHRMLDDVRKVRRKDT
jgi:hypothetical protein